MIRATRILFEAIVSFVCIDFAFDWFNQPSDWKVLGAIGILFLVAMFWVYKYSHMKRGKAILAIDQFQKKVMDPWTPEEKPKDAADEKKPAVDVPSSSSSN